MQVLLRVLRSSREIPGATSSIPREALHLLRLRREVEDGPTVWQRLSTAREVQPGAPGALKASRFHASRTPSVQSSCRFSAEMHFRMTRMT